MINTIQTHTYRFRYSILIKPLLAKLQVVIMGLVNCVRAKHI